MTGEANSATTAEIRARATLALAVAEGPWDEGVAAEKVLDVGDIGEAGELVGELARDVLALVEVAEAARDVMELSAPLLAEYREHGYTDDPPAVKLARLEQALKPFVQVDSGGH